MGQSCRHITTAIRGIKFNLVIKGQRTVPKPNKRQQATSARWGISLRIRGFHIAVSVARALTLASEKGAECVIAKDMLPSLAHFLPLFRAISWGVALPFPLDIFREHYVAFSDHHLRLRGDECRFFGWHGFAELNF